MRKNEAVRRAAMVAMVAAVLMMGAGAASAAARKAPADGTLKDRTDMRARQVSSSSRVSSLRASFGTLLGKIRDWDWEGIGVGGSAPRLPVQQVSGDQ
jgi:hypothetical protein